MLINCTDVIYVHSSSITVLSTDWARTTSLHTDNGHPMKLFFIKIPNFGLGQTIRADKWDIWGIFGQFISTYFGMVSPLSMFSNNRPLFLIFLYIQIPNIYFGLELELGPQRIMDLAFVCPYSMSLHILRCKDCLHYILHNWVDRSSKMHEESYRCMWRIHFKKRQTSRL